MHINLPKINIKSFGGDLLEWLTFWDSFSAAMLITYHHMEIHNRTSPVVGRILRKTCWTSEKMSQENYRQSLSEHVIYVINHRGKRFLRNT